MLVLSKEVIVVVCAMLRSVLSRFQEDLIHETTMLFLVEVDSANGERAHDFFLVIE